MKKVLFLIRAYDIASSRVRVLLLMDKLKKKGYDITCQLYPKKGGDKIKLFGSLKNYDIVFIQKKMPSILDTFLFRFFSKNLLFDFDDAIQLKHESNSKKRSRGAEIKYAHILKNSDVIIVGNSVLAADAMKYNKNVEIVPSVVETDGMPVRDYSVKNDKFIVGWVGIHFNLPQLELLEGVFQRLSKEIPLEVRVLCDRPPKMEGFDMKFVKWTLEGQDKEISSFDAGVMPLPFSEHAKGKCGYKAIQYMACGVVPVVSDVGSNADIVVNNESGFVVQDIDSFYDRLKYIYEHPQEAAKLGEAAAKRARSHFSVDAAVDLLDGVFQKL